MDICNTLECFSNYSFSPSRRTLMFPASSCTSLNLPLGCDMEKRRISPFSSLCREGTSISTAGGGRDCTRGPSSPCAQPTVGGGARGREPARGRSLLRVPGVGTNRRLPLREVAPGTGRSCILPWKAEFPFQPAGCEGFPQAVVASPDLTSAD